MANSKKPVAYIYEDRNGAFALNCRTKKQALKLIQAEIDDYINAGRDEEDKFDEEIIVKEEDLKEDWAYPGHRKCNGGYTIGENICFGCGEYGGGRAKKCYSFTQGI